jgi:PadR family transcriptional regulator, regulatory protein AphA
VARVNKSKYAILGVLSMGPRTGYEIRQFIAASLANFWNESYGQIYPILNGLVAEGLASRETRSGDGARTRHVYTLTPAGEQELRAWLSTPADHEVGRVEVLLKLFFGWQVPMPHNLEQVAQLRARQEELLATYAGIASYLSEARSHESGYPYWLLTISYGQHVARALLDWCDEAHARLEVLTHDRETHEPVDPGKTKEEVQ